jgi:hypothetical protein
MGILRKASASTVTLKLDEESWIEVREELGHKEFKKVINQLPEGSEEGKLSGPQALEVAELFFDIFVVGWSLPETPTLEEYQSLAPESTQAIATALSEHFNSLSVNQDEGKGQENLPSEQPKVIASRTREKQTPR